MTRKPAGGPGRSAACARASSRSRRARSVPSRIRAVAFRSTLRRITNPFFGSLPQCNPEDRLAKSRLFLASAWSLAVSSRGGKRVFQAQAHARPSVVARRRESFRCFGGFSSQPSCRQRRRRTSPKPDFARGKTPIARIAFSRPSTGFALPLSVFWIGRRCFASRSSIFLYPRRRLGTRWTPRRRCADSWDSSYGCPAAPPPISIRSCAGSSNRDFAVVCL